MKPLLAATVEDLKSLRFPLIASPKIDGIRALVIDRSVYSRSMKRLPNDKVQMLFGQQALDWYDGELAIGSPTDPNCYRRTMSAVMSDNGCVDGITFWVFDHFSVHGMEFRDRLQKLKTSPYVRILTQIEVRGVEELLNVEDSWVSRGYEGVMLRDPRGHYKQGRSTLREGILMKLKRFKDDEAEVTGYTELMHNANEARIGELGQTVRSSHQENKIGKGVLGALKVRWRDKEFHIGTGFDAADREILWEMRDQLAGRLLKFKYLEVGMKDLPRHPVFLGWRITEDMD